MANKHQVIAYFKAHPDSTSTLIGDELGCDPAYVRATLRRAGLKLTGTLRRPNSIRLLGQAARRAGLTLADIEQLASSRGWMA